MYRQDCVSGCPRTVVQRWSGVQNGQFVVPEMPSPVAAGPGGPRHRRAGRRRRSAKTTVAPVRGQAAGQCQQRAAGRGRRHRERCGQPQRRAGHDGDRVRAGDPGPRRGHLPVRRAGPTAGPGSTPSGCGRPPPSEAVYQRSPASQPPGYSPAHVSTNRGVLDMGRRRTHAVIIGSLALVASTLGVTQAAGSAAAGTQPVSSRAAVAPVAAKAAMPTGLRRRQRDPGALRAGRRGVRARRHGVRRAQDRPDQVLRLQRGHRDVRRRGRRHRLRRPDRRGQQLRRPRADRHHRRPAVPGAPFRLRQLHLQQGPRPHPGRRRGAAVGRARGRVRRVRARRRRRGGAQPGQARLPRHDPGLPAHRHARRGRLGDGRPAASWCWCRTAARSSPATPRATWPSAPTASSTPRPATAPASAARTSARPTSRPAPATPRARPAPTTRPTRAARCAPRTSAPAATRSASTARSSG